MASHFAEQGGDASATALTWSPTVPQALVAESWKVLKTDPVQAERLLQRAAVENPANGMIYVMLAGIRESQGRMDVAERLMSVADQLAPLESNVQILVLDFWFRRGQLEKILSHLNIVLQQRTDLHSRLFPVVLELVERPDTRYATLSFFNQPLAWWSSFFNYAAANAKSFEVVRLLYYNQSLQHAAGAGQAFLKRLEKEREWTEMYFTWLNSLTDTEVRELGNLYNGSFELLPSQSGFDWRTPKTAGVSINVSPTDGVLGEKALQVGFRSHRIQSSPLFQYLFLNPGRYQLRGQVRVKELEGEHGVQWRLRCVDANPKILGLTARFLGSSPWREFALDFEVPTDSCGVQMLELIVVGRVALDFEVRGDIWFDALTIVKTDE